MQNIELLTALIQLTGTAVVYISTNSTEHTILLEGLFISVITMKHSVLHYLV